MPKFVTKITSKITIRRVLLLGGAAIGIIVANAALSKTTDEVEDILEIPIADAFDTDSDDK